MHDGRRGIYNIVTNGRKETLSPLEEPLRNEICMSVRTYLVDGRKFLDGLKSKNVCYSLIPKELDLKSEEEKLEEIK